ncbi:pentatricopeptide repeat-containing protein At1g09220, mitochondrial-like [Olea europaea var. sylvestris]|uniref:pentatricopeptide repeat-containing protein At1g09220, mitochondrial-like n=1 Tax=Olea europaea var. sylvestris TaxID=158386 RepID=UPI000C1D23E0|nr:pentatricopeptide repeat-containing protein At1g09220, mitochondrial-like [Olea europaea var. sylvestris]
MSRHQFILSLPHRLLHCRRAIQQFHSHLLVHEIENANILLTVWNSIIKHYSLSSFPNEAIFVFKHLIYKYNPVFFDSFTYSYLIKACANLKRPRIGNQLHCLSLKVGFEFHVYVQTAVVNMYGDCGSMVEAKKVFDEMPERNLVTWNVLITGFCKWGEIESARSVFDVMPEKNVVSWTGLIDGCTRMNQFDEALSLFRRMVVHEGIKPTELSLLAIYPAIWNVRCLEFGQMVHAYGEKSGLNAFDIRVMNCLIDAYAKCGSIECAQRVFEDILDERRNLVSWTSIISGFAMHGMAKEASDCYKRMEDESVKPNRITLLSVLNACSHGGLVDEGLDFFRKFVDKSGIAPDIKHYGSLIDLLGRAGRLDEAEKIALEIPTEIGNVVVWRTLLGACSFHGNVEMGQRITHKIMDIEKEYGGDYVLLSNIFAGAGRYEDSERMRSLMDRQNASKVPGLSLL